MKRLTSSLVLGLLLAALVVPPLALGATFVKSPPAAPAAQTAPRTATPKAAISAAPTAAAPAAAAPTAATPAAAAAAAAPAKITGKVVSVSGTTLVVDPAGATLPVTVTTNAGTVVTINRTTALLSYLQAGMSVVVTPATGAAVTVAATAPVPKAVVGTIVSINSSGVVIKPAPAAAAQVTVAMDSSTVITLGGKAAALASIFPGMKVTAHPWFSGKASLVAVAAPMPKAVAGTVVSVSGASVVVQPAAATAAPVTVVTDANTVMTLNAKTCTLASIFAGMKATAQPWYNGKALSVKVTAPMPKAVVGSIVSVSGSNIVIQPTAATAAPVTVATDSNTVLTLNGAGCTMGSLAAGQKVKAQPWYNGKALSVAATVPPTPTLVNCARCHNDGRTGNPPGTLPRGHKKV